jgi:hypothetical protein
VGPGASRTGPNPGYRCRRDPIRQEPAPAKAGGHKYLTLVYQIEQDCTRLLWIGKDRTIESFEQFFTLIGKPLSEGIAFVCSDMWKPYLRVIRERCPNALNILDRFHIVAKMNDALDDVRAAEARRLAQDGYEPVLHKARWCVLKRKANLTRTQRFRLRDLLRYNLQTVRAYLLKEDFQQFWDYTSPTWAAKFLDDWCQQAMRSRIEPIKKVAKTLRGHRALILNYFRAKKQLSSGVVEGLNNKAKVTIRKSAPRCLVWVAEFGLASHERDDRLLVVDAAPVDLWATRLRCPQIHRRDLASAFRQPEWSHWSAPLPDRSESDGGRSPQP